MKKFYFYCSLITGYCLLLYGCASAPYVKPSYPPITMPGTYHTAEKGETLWRISKLYAVDVEELAQANRINDAGNLEIGQQIFIPNRKDIVSPLANYSNDDFIWPMKGKVITSYGSTFNNMLNKGINIKPVDSSDVFASRTGKVTFLCDDFGAFGKTVIIDHGDGLSTVYARNAQVFVRAGDNIKKGALIARAGSAGKNKGTYLHFEIRKGYLSQNPYYYLP